MRWSSHYWAEQALWVDLARLGTVVGAFILGILSTSLNMLGLSPDIQTIVKGVVTLIAILAQRFALDHRKT